MRIGLMRHTIEIWDTVRSTNNLGQVEEVKEMLRQTKAAVKHINNSVEGDITKGNLTTIDFTLRYNKIYDTPNNTMYIKWRGNEYDIISNNHYYNLNKYITLTAVLRGK